jgi:hypothetical protein
MASKRLRKPDPAVAMIARLDHITQLSGVRDVLRVLVEHFHSDGVILWEVAQGLQPLTGRRLFVQSQYFPDGLHPPFFDNPMTSISGRAILDGKAVHRKRGKQGWPEPIYHPDAMARLGIVAFATFPVRLRGVGAGPCDAALTFYSKTKPFSNAQLAALQQHTALFPTVYRSVLTKVSLNLLTVIHVKGGVKMDHRGGEKIDHFLGSWGFALRDLQGRLQRRTATRLAGRA